MRIERQVVFWLLLLAILVFLLWLLHGVLLPFVVGAAVAYLLDPLASWLTRRGMNRLVAALLILAVMVVVGGGALILIAPVLAGQLAGFIGKLPDYIRHLQAILTDPSNAWLSGLIGGSAGDAGGSEGIFNKIIDYLPTALTGLWTRGEALLSVLSLLVITPVVAFYLLVDWDRVVRALDGLIPLKQRDTVRALARDIDAALSGYLRGQLTVCVILGVYYAVALTLAGLNFGLLIGALSGLLTFIPYVGSLTALIVSLAVALAQFYPQWGHILAIVAVVLVGQFVEGNILSPKLVGESVGLHPVWLIFALLACGFLFGFVGLVMAVPIAAAAGVLTRFGVARYRASQLFTGTTPP